MHPCILPTQKDGEKNRREGVSPIQQSFKNFTEAHCPQQSLRSSQNELVVRRTPLQKGDTLPGAYLEDQAIYVDYSNYD